MSLRLLAAGAALLLARTPAPAGEFPVSRLTDTAGRAHELAPAPGAKALAVVFLNPECPLCRRYAPTLNRLAGGLDPGAARFFGVVSGSSVTRAAAAKYADEFRLSFPV